MSDGSLTYQILTEPLKNIGAQDILRVEGKLYDGTLRKRGKIDKFIGSTKWKQRFVVISQGCVYCFKDEYAQKPLSAFALSVYERVQEVEISGVLNCFEIIHETDKPSQYFSCETEDRRKAWIGYITDAIAQTRLHSMGGNLSNESVDEGISLPRADMTKHRKSRGPLPPLPPTPNSGGVQLPSSGKSKHKVSEYSLESDEEDEKSVYDEVGNTDPPHHQPLTSPARKHMAGQVPVLPGLGGINSKPSISQRPPLEIPTKKKPPFEPPTQKKAPLELPTKKSSYTPVDLTPGGKTVIGGKTKNTPDYQNEIFKEIDYRLHSKDRETVKRLLNGREPGTFLIRDGNNTAFVLCVVTDDGSKDFQIFEENNKVTLNKSTYFPSVDAMLAFYNQNFLPKNEYQVKLKQGYAARD